MLYLLILLDIKNFKMFLKRFYSSSRSRFSLHLIVKSDNVASVSRNPKQGYQCPQKRIIVFSLKIKKNNIVFINPNKSISFRLKIKMMLSFMGILRSQIFIIVPMMIYFVSNKFRNLLSNHFTLHHCITSQDVIDGSRFRFRIEKIKYSIRLLTKFTNKMTKVFHIFVLVSRSTSEFTQMILLLSKFHGRDMGHGEIPLALVYKRFE